MCVLTTREQEIEKGVGHINTLAFPLQGSASDGEKRSPDEPTIVELFAACLSRLTPDQCADVLEEVGDKIENPGLDTKKYLAMLFVDVLNEGYKEYLILEKSIDQECSD